MPEILKMKKIEGMAWYFKHMHGVSRVVDSKISFSEESLLGSESAGSNRM
jgi:hypothetical protein